MVIRRIELEKAVEELLEVVFGIDVLLEDHLEHGVPEIEKNGHGNWRALPKQAADEEPFLFAMNVHSLFVNPVMSMKGGKAFKLVLSAKLGSPRVEGDEEEDDFDDLDHEFDYNSSVRRYPHHVVEAALAARLNVGYGVKGFLGSDTMGKGKGSGGIC
nr:cellulose synthase A catalytic subunit 2 [UDP-forming]-like [Ipomoea batatas]